MKSGMTGALALTISGLMVAAHSWAAQRTVYFSAIAQSHLTADSAGSGNIHLACLVTIQNLTTGGTQRIRDWSMVIEAAVPTAAGLQPALKNLVTAGTPVQRAYQYCNLSACAVTTTTSLPSAGSNMLSLDPAGVAANHDGVHIRGAVLFPYKTTDTYAGGGNPQTNQHIMHYCSGRITVEDVTTAGSVIASGVFEAVGDNYANPSITYGVAPNNSAAADTAATSGATEDFQNGLADRSEGTCNFSGVWPGTCWDAVTAAWVTTGVGCGTSGRHPIWNGFAAVSSNNTCYYGGDTTATTGSYGAWSTGSCAVSNINDKGTARTYSAFPQHLANVPFFINGGKPF